jgi:4-hydroxythreonine-4-phosphate dehydrogenase
MTLSLLAVTLGDVCGIGPEIIIKALGQRDIYQCCKPVVIGDKNALKKAAQLLKREIKFVPPPWEEEIDFGPGIISLVSESYLEERDLIYGKPNPKIGKAAFTYIKTATSLALAKKVDGIVTCPVNKAVINAAGIPFLGHTDLLAALTHSKRYAMLFVGKRLKVVLATIHVPLKEVPRLINQEKLLSLIVLTHHFFLKKLNIKNPRIAIAALNPHAGEGGLIGQEEIEIIIPVIKKAQQMGINIMGPLPPDTLFYWAKQSHYDVVISMYHDQALIPFKLLHFCNGVNVTMGLPIVRTSVDHGTAYDIAGKGKADESSLVAAIKLAAEISSSSFDSY